MDIGGRGKGLRRLSAGKSIQCEVTASDDGSRLDRWLAEQIDELSRNRIQALITDGHVSLNPGQECHDPSKRIRDGDVYLVVIPPLKPAIPEPQSIPLDVLFEDEHLIVIDKPAGLVVHPAPGHHDGTLVNALLHHCAGTLSGIGGVTRPGIVHRLDKDTSGIMVCAKSDGAHQGLVEQFRDHSIDRAYFAIVYGAPEPKKGVIEERIGRDRHNRKKMAVVKTGGKEAKTAYRTLREIGSLASLIDCHLFTGRTHQIRVHMSSIGHALVGDPVYRPKRNPILNKGSDTRNAIAMVNNQALQAYNLGFIHPIFGKKMTFERPLSLQMSNLIKKLDEI